MASCNPIIQSYKRGEIAFDDLVRQLVEFDWTKPTPEQESYGDYPEHYFGQVGTFEEIEAARILGDLTQKEFDVIRSALNAELVRKYGPEILQPKG